MNTPNFTSRTSRKTKHISNISSNNINSSLKSNKINKHTYSNTNISEQNINNNNNKFSPNIKLVNQIFKVIKIRLIIENIKISDEKIIQTIKQNLNLIDVRYLKLSSINILIDDIIEILKNDYKNEKINIHKPQSTILDFNRKEYLDTNLNNIIDYNPKNMNWRQYYREQEEKNRIQKPMKFNLDNNTLYNKNKENEFYMDRYDNEMTQLTDYDIEEMKERIIDEVSKEHKPDESI